MPYLNRTEAGRRLAEELKHCAGERVAVFALPRGGVSVAAPIAAALNAPLDLILVRKIGVPFQPELAMGALADGQHPLAPNRSFVRQRQYLSNDGRLASLKTFEREHRHTISFGLAATFWQQLYALCAEIQAFMICAA